MKKSIFLAALVCCAMTTVFCSCNNEEDKLKPEPEDTTPVAAMMDYTMTVGDDLLNYFDVKVEYYSNDGRLQAEMMTQKEWKKSVKAILPVKLGARLTVEPKEGVNFDELEQFTVSYGYSYRGYAVTSNDKVVGKVVSGGTNSTMTMKGDKVSTWQERHADGIVKYLYSFAADGQATSTDWE